VLAELEDFMNDPSRWSAAHGGIADFDQAKAA
jgi:orotate phosphoribosyltransferase